MPITAHQKHVAALPFPFASHPLSLMRLLLKLADSSPNILFSFFSTQKSNNSLISSSPFDQLPDNIKLYDVDDGIPAGHTFTGKLHEQVDLFLSSAPQSLTTAIEKAVAETGIKISCVISDTFLTFSGDIAENFDASWIARMSSPFALSAHFYTRDIREKVDLGRDKELDFVPGLSLLRLKDVPADILRDDSVFTTTLAQMGEKLPKAAAVAVNCFQELVPEALNDDLKSKFKNYLNLGFLSMSFPPESQLPESGSDQTGCLQWLNTQSPKSVAYISFGTAVALPEEEQRALAEALESSDIPFLWSLKDSLRSNLPDGFIERTKAQGKIVPWAPQNSVLAHDSVAVFVSHGGYNSVCESLVYGVPMICRPVFADQMMHARIVEAEWGVGVTVEDGVITKKGLLKDLGIFLASDGERGKKIRENSEKLKKVVSMAALPNGAAARDFNKLVDIVSEV